MQEKEINEAINKYSLIRHKDIFITNEEASILENYDFDYKKYNSLDSLLFDLEEYLNTGFADDTFEYVLSNLTERKYYLDTNK